MFINNLIPGKIKQILFFGITIYLLCYFLFNYPFSFNFETELTGQYLLGYLFPFFSLMVLIYMFQKPAVSTYPSFLIYLALLFLFSLISFSRKFSFTNEHFFIIATVVIFSAMTVLFAEGLPFSMIIIALLLLFLYQLIVGFVQYLNSADSAKISLLIKGDLQNSGIYSCWLVIQLPFAYYAIFHLSFKKALQTAGNAGLIKKILRKWQTFHRAIYFSKIVFFVLLLMAVVFLVYQAQSRSAMMALTAFFITHGVNQWGSSFIRKKTAPFSKAVLAAIPVILLVPIALGAYYLFYLKRLSAIGRVMMWHVTWEHISDNFWLGTGLGRFSWYYPQWQAQYFQSHASPPLDFFLSAGETYMIFNEYLQLFKEIGFIGFILFVIALCFFFTSRSATHKQLLNGAKGTVVTILACAFTSYPLHVTPVLLVLAFCFTIAVTVRDYKPQPNKYFLLSRIPVTKTLLFLLFIVSCYASYKSIKQCAAVKNWNNLRKNYFLSREQVKTRYSDLYPTLQHDGKFLTDYGEFLLQDSMDAPKAIDILEQAKGYFISQKTIEATGNACLKTHNYTKAIQNTEWLSYFRPNSFGVKYELLNLYKQSGNLIKARSIANTILTMPVKIPSYEVTRIKENTRQILKMINN